MLPASPVQNGRKTPSTYAAETWSGWVGDKLSAIGTDACERIPTDEEEAVPTIALLYPLIYSSPSHLTFLSRTPFPPLFYRHLWPMIFCTMGQQPNATQYRGTAAECLGFELALALDESVSPRAYKTWC